MKKRFNFFFRDVMKPWLTKLLKINMWSSVFPWVFWHCKFWASFFHFVCAKLLAKTEIIIINTDIGTMQLVLIPMLLRDIPLQEINNNLNNKKVNNRHFYKIYSEYLRRINSSWISHVGNPFNFFLQNLTRASIFNVHHYGKKEKCIKK